MLILRSLSLSPSILIPPSLAPPRLRQSDQWREGFRPVRDGVEISLVKSFFGAPSFPNYVFLIIPERSDATD